MDDVYDDHDNDDPLAIGGVLELTLDFHKYNVTFWTTSCWEEHYGASI